MIFVRDNFLNKLMATLGLGILDRLSKRSIYMIFDSDGLLNVMIFDPIDFFSIKDWPQVFMIIQP